MSQLRALLNAVSDVYLKAVFLFASISFKAENILI